MRGFNTVWLPGTDHAGIATQTVVEKRLLQSEGKRRTDYGRDEFVAKVQAWKDEFEATITGQLKDMGCSCDWDRQRFTMDPICAKAVREAFFRLFKQGLVYRGKRLVHWDPATQTALADDEVEMVEVDGSFWYLKYPVIDEHDQETGEFVTVATTRPETMLGDTAIAVNPNDPPRAAFLGKRVRLPIVNRIVPVIGDDYVVVPDADSPDPKAQFATGFLKVTPAHDPNDWDIGQRHKLAIVNILAPDASISREHGWPAEEFESGRAKEAEPFLGMPRDEARKAVVRWFTDHELLAEVKPYRHTVGHSYRSHVPIEPYLSDQWYVKVSDDRLVGEAQRALHDEQFEGTKPTRSDDGSSLRGGDGELSFHPPRYAKMYQSWHENLRDWCISRQLWWGHRIPAWRRPKALRELDESHLEQIDDLLQWQRDGRICMQYRGEYEPHTRHELEDVDLTAFFVCVRDPEGEDREIVAALEASGLEQDPDVLDTWFSSALWPLSTMGWPEPDAHGETRGLLDAFTPTSVLCTAREIVTLWVSRMVMFNRFFTDDGRVPFRDVYIHAMIQDGHGQKMSKSLGNGVDPRDIIRSHGADALRFALTQLATATQDVRLPVDTMCPHCGETFHPKEITSPAGYRVADAHQSCPSCGKRMIAVYGVASGIASPSEAEPLALNTSNRFDAGRNFANKLWNATRFALRNLSESTNGTGAGKPTVDAGMTLDDLAVVDRWIISRLHKTLHLVEDAVASYQFNVYADAMYNFVWGDFCDWYLEAIKPTVRDHPGQQQVLRTVLNAAMRMLHPICPFVTEALWPHVQAAGDAGVDGITLPSSELLAGAAWPDIACRVHDDEALEQFGRVQALINAITGVTATDDTTHVTITPTTSIIKESCLMDLCWLSNWPPKVTK
jgi:valyl-tRNA synthetase